MKEHDERTKTALHALMEDLAEATGVLAELKTYILESEARYIRFAHKMQSAWTKTAIGLVVALAVGGYIVGEVRQAGTNANEATKDLKRFADENRQLIHRLEVVANRAQTNGAEADKRQCREIEALKAPIREVLTQAGVKQYLPLFKRQSCRDLPNSKPVKP